MIPYLGSVVKPPPIENTSFTQIASREVPKGYWHIYDEMVNQVPEGRTSTLEYPIVDLVANTPMKFIPLQNIRTFHGMTTEDPNTFLFKFNILCIGYDYTIDPKKLKLFPSTLKGAALRWFMGLGGCTITLGMT